MYKYKHNHLVTLSQFSSRNLCLTLYRSYSISKSQFFIIKFSSIPGFSLFGISIGWDLFVWLGSLEMMLSILIKLFSSKHSRIFWYSTALVSVISRNIKDLYNCLRLFKNLSRMALQNKHIFNSQHLILTLANVNHPKDFLKMKTNPSSARFHLKYLGGWNPILWIFPHQFWKIFFSS